MTSRSSPGRWDLEVEAGAVKQFRLQAALGSLVEPLVPCSVLWQSEPLPPGAWHYDDTDAVLHAEFEGADGRLSVRGCD